MNGFLEYHYLPHVFIRVGPDCKEYGDPYVNGGHGEILIPGILGYIHKIMSKTILWLAMRLHKKMRLHIYGIIGHVNQTEYLAARKVTFSAGFGLWEWEKVDKSGHMRKVKTND